MKVVLTRGFIPNISKNVGMFFMEWHIINIKTTPLHCFEFLFEIDIHKLYKLPIYFLRKVPGIIASGSL